MIEAKYVNIAPLIAELNKKARHTDEFSARITLEIAVEYLNQLPTDGMKKEIHARLVDEWYDDTKSDKGLCSVCGTELENYMNYCYYCGATIDGRSES